MSLDAVAEHTGQLASAVPPRYTSQDDDAGNGSIVRLAPVPIRFHRNLHKAIQIAEAQNHASHLGPSAAACCAVMTCMTANAIQRPAADSCTLGELICDQTQKFLKEYSPPISLTDNSETKNLASLLSSNPPTDSESLWAWREPHPLVNETLLARAESCNGYHVNPVYFGSYCMDGLAMAKWALHGSKNFADCMIRIVNLLGDADTTGAIAGQIASVFYGYKAFDSDPISSRMLSNLKRWDPLHEIPLRALLLNDDSVEIGS
jgi:ADP-ribosyl-[dinitrogen reductase] hydrolase